MERKVEQKRLQESFGLFFGSSIKFGLKSCEFNHNFMKDDLFLEFNVI